MSALCSPPHLQRATELKYGKKRVCRVNNCLLPPDCPMGWERPARNIPSAPCVPFAVALLGHTPACSFQREAREPPYRPPSASPASSVLGTGRSSALWAAETAGECRGWGPGVLEVLLEVGIKHTPSTSRLSAPSGLDVGTSPITCAINHLF